MHANYKKIVFNLIETRELRELPLTSDIVEDEDLINIMMKNNVKSNGELLLSAKNLTIIKKYNEPLFSKIIFSSYNKERIEYTLKSFPEICQDENYVTKFIDLNDQLISEFPHFHNLNFLMKRLDQNKTIGLNRLSNFQKNKDISIKIINNDNEKDLRWIDKSFLYDVDIAWKMIQYIHSSKQILEAIKFEEKHPLFNNQQFYKIGILTNPYNITNIYTNLLDKKIDWSAILYESLCVKNKSYNLNKHSEISKDCFNYLLQLPESTWKNTDNISIWLDVISHNCTDLRVYCYEAKIIDLMIINNPLFKQFSQTPFMLNNQELLQSNNQNKKFEELILLKDFLNQISNCWNNFKLEHDLAKSNIISKKSKI